MVGEAMINMSLDGTAQVVLGCSPFLAGRQFADRRERYLNTFEGKPDAIWDVWTAFLESGGRALHLVDEDRLVTAFENLDLQGRQPEVWLTISGDAERWCQWASAHGGTYVFRHASQVDGGEDLAEFKSIAVAYGLRPGAATHSPGRTLCSRIDPTLDSDCAFLIPFNPVEFCMDVPPLELHAKLSGHPAVIAMMPLGSGRVSFLEGAGFAGIHFARLMIGTGDPRHAREIARLPEFLDVLRLSRTLQRTRTPHLDISESSAEVVLLRDHRGVRLSGATVALWHRLAEPCALRDLIKWASEESRMDPILVNPGVAAALLALIRLGAVEGHRS